MARVSYRIVTLLKFPSEDKKSGIAAQTCNNFRELRLESLRTSPEAFASSFEVERHWGLDKTWERLGNPKATHLIALEGAVADISGLSREVQMDIIASATWLGMIVLLGPQDAVDGGGVTASADPFGRMTAPELQSSSTLPNQHQKSRTVLQYHLNAMFVTPKTRGAGIGMALIREALKKARDQAASLNVGFKCSILVHQENISARQLYQKAGFAEVGEEEYIQQQVNLSGENDPQKRLAVHMEYVA